MFTYEAYEPTRAERAYAGYRGGSAELGRHTTRYDEGVVRTVSASTPGLVAAEQETS